MPIVTPPFIYTFEAIHTLSPIFIGFGFIENSFFDSSNSIILELTVQLGAKNTLFPAMNSAKSNKTKL